MAVDAQAVIEAMIRALETSPHTAARSRKPVVTVARMAASRGDEIAHALADRLGVPCHDRDVLDAVAARSGTSARLLERLTEKVDALDTWLYSAVFGATLSRHDYHGHLSAVVRALYHTGGVILGRGAHLILAGRDVLRVRIVGSVDACASRLSEDEGVSYVDAKRIVMERNEARDRFVYEVFGRHLWEPTTYDLIVNTDSFRGDDEVVDVILAALKGRRTAVVDVQPSSQPADDG